MMESRWDSGYGTSRSRWGCWSRFQWLNAASLVSAKEIATSAIQRGRRKLSPKIAQPFKVG
jgi:hypothetical protein